MTSILFDGLSPTRTLYVTTGSGSGDGSLKNPYHSVQAAVNAATPGTMISVSPGTYTENIKIPSNKGGTASAPVWLVARDGQDSVQIKAADTSKPVIQALGVDNYVIKNLNLSGGYDGIQFNQSGKDFTNLVNNIALIGNEISNVSHDGIKFGQANNVYIGGNQISKTTEEGIDFVAVNNGVIEGNEVSFVGSKAAGIFAKGGSTNVQILKNYVHDVVADGISAGGNTDATSFRPGFTSYEAKSIVISGNDIENVGKQPVSVRGASYVTVDHNYLEGATSGIGVYVTGGNPAAAKPMVSSHVDVTDNVLAAVKTVIKTDSGNATAVTQTHNVAGLWSDLSGVAAWAAEHGGSTHSPEPASAPIVPVVPVGTSAGTGSVPVASPIAQPTPDGADTISFAAASAGVTVNLLKPTKNVGIAGGTIDGVHHLTGSNYGDSLTGDNGANTLIGGGGNDNLSGQGGADVLVGGLGNDSLAGNGGNDRLVGGLGDDKLSGGSSGRDWFAFDASHWGHDTVSDFEDGLDLLDFRGSSLHFADLNLSQQSGGVLIDGGDSSILIQNMQLAKLSAADFLF